MKGVSFANMTNPLGIPGTRFQVFFAEMSRGKMHTPIYVCTSLFLCVSTLI